MLNTDTYRIFPLGDAAITLDFGNTINEAINHKVIALSAILQQRPIAGMIEVVPTYSSLTIYYDVFQVKKKTADNQTAFGWMSDQLNELLNESITYDENASRVVTIPVCYEETFAPDMASLAARNNLSIEEIIRLHTSKTYRVYMLGFLPGFAYMAEVDEKLIIPRKDVPAPRVEAGSVGIAGKQTGIYPLASPGGWQIIGRTPLRLFNLEKEDITLLKEGDTVQFISISSNEFTRY